MDIRIYAEGTRQDRNTGRTLGVGDDALPYVGKHMISAADGAGGRGFKSMDGIAKELLDPAVSFDTMMRDCDMDSRKSYRKQYDENFAQLYELGSDYYKAGGRRSSYFGSRLATMFLRKIVEEEEFPRESIGERFAQIAGMDRPQRDAYLLALETRMAGKLQRLMRQAAKNGNLALPEGMNTANVNLMSTTYSGMCFYEDEDRVYVLSIQAGDSMMWGMVVEDDPESERPRLALRQLQPTQESKNGVLVNSINADGDFYLRCAWHSLKKPCGLMVASDGCFDAFETHIHFERFLMWQLMQANTIEEAGHSIQRHFENSQTGDDSSSMAMRLFGFEDHIGISEMANRRQSQLYRDFDLGNAALYDTYESAEYFEEEARLKVNKAIKRFAAPLWDACPFVREMALEEGRRTQPEQLEEAIEAVRRANVPDSEIEAVCQKLVEAVGDNWLSIRRPMVRGHEGSRMGLFRKPEDIYDMMRRRDQLRAELVQIHEAVRDGTDRLKAIADGCGFTGETPYDALQDGMYDFIAAYTETWNLLSRQLDRLDSADRRFADSHAEVIAETGRILRAEDAHIRSYAARLLETPERAAQIRDISDEARARITQIVEQYQQLKCLRSLSEEKLRETEMTFARRFYDGKAFQFASECVENHFDRIPEELRGQIEAELEPLRRAHEEAGERLELKKRYLENYRATVCGIMTDRS